MQNRRGTQSVRRAGLMVSIALAAARPGLLSGQSSLRLIDHLVREVPIEKHNVAPDSSVWNYYPCTPTSDKPDSMAFFSAWGPTELKTWTRSYGGDLSWDSPQYSYTWNSVDTLRARLVGLYCDHLGSVLLLERDGLYFSLGTDGIGHSYDYSVVRFGVGETFVIGAGGALDPAVLDESSSEGNRGLAILGSAGLAAGQKRLQEEKAARDSASQAVAEASAEASEAKRVAEIRAKRWPRRMKTAVVDREVMVGMSEAMVLLSWGGPDDINTTATAQGSSEQWVYGNNYVYFANGVVTAFQTSTR